MASALTAPLADYCSKCQAALAALELQNWQLKAALVALMVLVMVGVFVREVIDEREKATAKQR